MKVIKPNEISLTGGSFSRASVGTYYDVNGEIKTAAINEPRFQTNPVTSLFDGMLIETASTNLIGFSTKFDAGTWYAGNCVVTATGNTFYPSGVYSVRPTAAGGLSNSIPTTIGSTYTFSVYIKKYSLTSVIVYLTDSSWNAHSYVSIDMNTGTANHSSGIYELKKFKNGWIRVILTGTATTSNSFVNISGVYAAGETKEFLIACAQAEQGTKATSYINNSSSSNTTRSADVVSTSQAFIYSNVANTNSDWSSSTAYSIGIRANYQGYIYEAIAASTNKQPDLNPTIWSLVGPDNKHAALDASASTATQTNGDLVISFVGGSYDAMGIINMEGLTLEVAISNSTGTLYTNSVGISGTAVSNWYDYFFLSPLQDLARTQIVMYNMDMSLYPTAVTTVRIKNGTNLSSVGLISVGKLYNIGGTQYGASAGITDYSIKSTDEFGNTSFLQRNYSKKLNTRVYVDNTNLNGVQRLLYKLRATPCVWIGTENPTYEEAMVVWGFYKDFTTEISYPSYALVSIEIEGLA